MPARDPVATAESPVTVISTGVKVMEKLLAPAKLPLSASACCLGMNGQTLFTSSTFRSAKACESSSRVALIAGLVSTNRGLADGLLAGCAFGVGGGGEEGVATEVTAELAGGVEG